MADPPETAANEIPEEPPSSPVKDNDRESEEGGEKEPSDDSASEEYLDDEVTHNNAKQEDDGKEVAEAAPQALASQQESSPARQTSIGSEGGLIDCKLSPLDVQDQRQNLKDVLMNKTAVMPPPLAEEESNNGDHPHVQFAEEQTNNDSSLIHQSALHQDEYSQYNDQQQHNPHNHESALGSAASSDNTSSSSNSNHKLNPFTARKKKTRLAPAGEEAAGGQSHGRHSHPRKSPYKSEMGRLRHAQQLEREKRKFSKDPPSPADDASNASTTASGKSISLKDTTAAPDTHFFSIQSSKFKHSLLHSLGEFLTSAFADDEESSGSYFSHDLLDQLHSSNPDLKGVWLQAKNLNDAHIKQLSEALIRNKVVTEVWIPSNQITDVGAAHIAHMLKFNHSIKELFLGQNDIGPKGAAALASALARGNTTLVALGLGDNHIGVEGAGAFAAALRHNHSLHTLDVKNNGIPKKSSIRGLLNKMLEFNASDPGDESLVLGLQEELSTLVGSLPPDIAESVVLQAEEALKMAMLCRKRGDKIGAAEAEGIFIRICTTGEPPVDPPEEMVQSVSSAVAAKKQTGGGVRKKKGRSKKPMEPDRLDGLNAELSSLKFGSEGSATPAPGEEEGGRGQGGEDETKEEESNSEEQPKKESETKEEKDKDDEKVGDVTTEDAAMEEPAAAAKASTEEKK